MIEDIARKASTFGGRIIEVGPECVKAAFGLDLIEDAARHAAHAAFAVQRAVGASAVPLEVRIALHTEEVDRRRRLVARSARPEASPSGHLRGDCAVSPCWRLAADIARAEGDWNSAEGQLRKSLDLAVSLGNPVQQWKAEIALGHLLHDASRTREARHAFQRAFGVMQQVRHTLREERLRGAFEKNSDLRLVQDLLAGI